jgi:hypothetical protein
MQASPSVRVVRLEYSNEKSKGRIVDSDILSAMFKVPLFRSANVISGLFHDGVVVTESDNDRAFYFELYHRLSEQANNFPSILFINAQGKHTIPDIIAPLRKLGIPAAGIVDSDVLEEGKSNWSKWLKAGNLPAAMHLALGQHRSDVHAAAKNANITEMKVQGGITRLPPADLAAATELCDQMDRHGVFIVRKGELENWLPELGVAGEGTEWVKAVFEKLGSDPNNAAYVRPSADDVWQFIQKIVSWITKPDRQGIL